MDARLCGGPGQDTGDISDIGSLSMCIACVHVGAVADTSTPVPPGMETVAVTVQDSLLLMPASPAALSRATLISLNVRLRTSA